MRSGMMSTDARSLIICADRESGMPETPSVDNIILYRPAATYMRQFCDITSHAHLS